MMPRQLLRQVAAQVKIIQTPRICQTHRDSSVQFLSISKNSQKFTSQNHFQGNVR